MPHDVITDSWPRLSGKQQLQDLDIKVSLFERDLKIRETYKLFRESFGQDKKGVLQQTWKNYFFQTRPWILILSCILKKQNNYLGRRNFEHDKYYSTEKKQILTSKTTEEEVKKEILNFSSKKVTMIGDISAKY